MIWWGIFVFLDCADNFSGGSSAHVQGGRWLAFFGAPVARGLRGSGGAAGFADDVFVVVICVSFANWFLSRRDSGDRLPNVVFIVVIFAWFPNSPH